MSTYIALLPGTDSTVFYSWGTRICTPTPDGRERCGLHPKTCQEAAATPDKIRKRKRAPECLLALAWYRLPGDADEVLELMEAVTRYIEPGPRFIAEYERLVNLIADYPASKGLPVEVGARAAWDTLAQGMSDRAFRRAVDIWASRVEFMQGLERAA